MIISSHVSINRSLLRKESVKKNNKNNNKKANTKQKNKTKQNKTKNKTTTTTTKKTKARFIGRTLHEPNLIIWLGACKDRHMNQFGSTDLFLGRSAVLFDWRGRIGRQKFDFDLYVELLHVPNQMNTLRINFI